MKYDGRQARGRPGCIRGGAFLGLALMVLAGGCRSDQVAVDSGVPTWVQQAEQQLSREPEARVAQTDSPGREPAGESWQTDWSGRQSSGERRQTSGSSRRDSSPKMVQPVPTTSAEPAAQPEGAPRVEWGETKITVEVED